MNNTSRLKAIAIGAFVGAPAVGAALTLLSDVVYGTLLAGIPVFLALVIGLQLIVGGPIMAAVKSARKHYASFLTTSTLLSIPAYLTLGGLTHSFG
jgi:uncharacterized membrane protein